MKKILTLIVVFSFTLTYSRSSCNCVSDLEAMYMLMIKMPFYKDQIKGTKKTEYDKNINGKIIDGNLIVDLWNNGGENNDVSDPFLKILTEYTKRNKVYVLINRKTMSNADQFTVKLKKLDNATVFLGEESCRMVAYGSNYSKKDPLAFSEYLEYEDIGFTPDIVLSPDNDRTQQVLKIISTGKAQ